MILGRAALGDDDGCVDGVGVLVVFGLLWDGRPFWSARFDNGLRGGVVERQLVKAARVDVGVAPQRDNVAVFQETRPNGLANLDGGPVERQKALRVRFGDRRHVAT